VRRRRYRRLRWLQNRQKRCHFKPALTDDPGEAVRALFYLEHTIQDGRTDKAGNRRVVSRQLQFVETDATGSTRNAGYAPYLDYRPATPEERTSLTATLESQVWLKGDLESVVVGHAIADLVREGEGLADA